MEITAYAIPAIVALFLKAGIYFYSRSFNVHNLQTRLFLLFLFGISVQDLTEIVAFMGKAQGLPNPPGGLLYFGASILFIGLLLHLALVMATSWLDNALSRRGRVTLMLLYLPTVTLEVLLWATPLLVVGFEPMTYTYTKIPGPLYFLFELYVYVYLCAAVALFVYGARREHAPSRRARNKIMLIGLAPFFGIVFLVVGLQRFGFRGFNTTMTLPIALTFFLAVAAYATHQHRLFDIQFYLPWSKVRKRKTVFYRRIQSVIAEIALLDSVKEIVELIAQTLHCPVALIAGAGAAPAATLSHGAIRLARLPLDELRKVDRILVANEIAEAMPAMHAAMKREGVAAIVPFYPHSQTAASWMLLGESLHDNVYTSLDFRVVENLFAQLADRFLDSQLLLRDQVSREREEMATLHKRLALAWEQHSEQATELGAARTENQALEKRLTMTWGQCQTLREELNSAREEMNRAREEIGRLKEQIGKLQGDLHGEQAAAVELMSQKDSEIAALQEQCDALRARLLREQWRVAGLAQNDPPHDNDADLLGPSYGDRVAEFEGWLIRTTLKLHGGDREATAREFRMRLSTLERLINNFELEADDGTQNEGED